MNSRKGLLKTLIAAVLFTAILLIANVSNASEAQNARILNIEEYRRSTGYKYKAAIVHNPIEDVHEQIMWKIYEYNSVGGTPVNINNAIYCLKMGVGFGSENGSPVQATEYKLYADMKQPTQSDRETLIKDYINTLPGASLEEKTQHYNSIVWVLDHCYVPAPAVSPTQEELDTAAESRAALLEAAGIPSTTKLNDDLIDLIQQLAIWYFSNDDKYQANNLTSIDAKLIDDSDYDSIDDIFGDWDLMGDINDPENPGHVRKLLNYFKTNGEANKNTSPSSTSGSPVELTAENVSAVLNGENYIVGPFKIEELSDIEYTLNASFQDVNGNNIPYTIIDKNGATKTLEQVIGQDFYLKVAKTANVEGAKFKLSVTVMQNSITYWTVKNPTSTPQPVAEVIKKPKIYGTEVTVSKKVFDLALRKSIVSVETNGVTTTYENPGDRLPNIDTSKLNTTDTNGNLITTAEYKHKKDPIVVEQGSLIIYEINVYNEGDIVGWPTEIKDQLPEGVEFREVLASSSNFISDGTYNPQTNLLTLTEIGVLGGDIGLQPYHDGVLDCATIDILCEVTATPDQDNDKIFTNIAWISKYAPVEYTDRDSVPANPAILPTAAELVTVDDGYTNEAKNAGKLLADKNAYFEGQEDDDDFEKIKLKAIKGSYDIILVKQDKDGKVLNSEATFEVNGEEVKVVGTLTIAKDVKITPDNLTEKDIYTIKELVPPDKYCKFDGVITVEVYKEKKDGKYVVKEIKYYVDGVEVTENRPDLKVYLNTDGNIYVEVKDYQFDLALRKFITKVNNVEVPTREPVIPEESNAKLQSGEITTVEKHHTKKPVKVQIGDTVLYTIRVYNEGDVAGYASEVTDYLPQGLILKENSSINTKYGWKNPSGDGKTIVTSYLADKLIPALADRETPKYVDLEIECVVATGVSTSSQYLKNVAEITEDKDENGKDVEDRDSTPKDLTDEQKENYNPGESEKGWGYEDDDDYEELVLPVKEFDLSLRKYITKVNDKEIKGSDGKYSREPNIDLTPLKDGTDTTAIYKHRKDPVGVKIGDIVIYTIRVYNEGEVDGYASEVTDYLPPQLEFVNDEFNANYGWLIDGKGRVAKTNFLSKTKVDAEENLIKAFDGEELDYKELQIKCKVISTKDLDKVITNIAEITACTDTNGKQIVDRDSTTKNLVLPNDSDLPDYKGNKSNKSVLSDKDYFYKGQEDDDDFDKLILQEFDLALRKFITSINDVAPEVSRVPVVDTSKLKNGSSTTATYTHPKNPLEVETADIVVYTLRIYNEGDMAGYAELVRDDIPEGLEFIPENEINKEYRWKMYDADGNETDDVSKATDVYTDYLSRKQGLETGRNNLLKPFDKTKGTLDYRDVKVAFKVVAPGNYSDIITNKAQISDDSDENGNDVTDRDSTPNEWIEGEDDQDVEHLKLTYFDLALRKFITQIANSNNNTIRTSPNDRVPVFRITEDGKYEYVHSKDPLDVENGEVVTYTLRVYNEGTKAGYAKEVKDDIPQGLEFLPDNEINKEYRWVMLDKDGNKTEDVSKAVDITTDYLSREQGIKAGRDNLLKPFDKETMEAPDYRDVKVAFKVVEPNTSDRIVINQAQISDDEDKDGKDVVDIDSTPNKWIEGEDDQDIEKIKVKYFDLALRKWVTQAIVIENGKEVVNETGHKAEDDPEEVVKVELKEKTYKNVVVKFRYKIRITNEGQIAGYCTEISDYIPEGLKFVQADNPEWKEVNGKIVTDQLKDTLLQPGDSAEVEVLLTWINGKDNFGLKKNVAEISKDKNDSDTPDIDSRPNNLKPGEDDIDDAPVILTVKTGIDNNITAIIGLTVISLAIISGGVVLIKKFVLK